MRNGVKWHGFKLLCNILMSQFLTVFSGCNCHLFVTPVNFPPCQVLNINNVTKTRKQNTKQKNKTKHKSVQEEQIGGKERERQRQIAKVAIKDVKFLINSRRNVSIHLFCLERGATKK